MNCDLMVQFPAGPRVSYVLVCTHTRTHTQSHNTPTILLVQSLFKQGFQVTCLPAVQESAGFSLSVPRAAQVNVEEASVSAPRPRSASSSQHLPETRTRDVKTHLAACLCSQNQCPGPALPPRAAATAMPSGLQAQPGFWKSAEKALVIHVSSTHSDLGNVQDFRASSYPKMLCSNAVCRRSVSHFPTVTPAAVGLTHRIK